MIGFLLTLLIFAPFPAQAGNIVAVKSRFVKITDESEEELCRLNRKTKIEIMGIVEDSEFLEAKIAIPGCPEKGYVPKDSVKGDLSGLPTVKFDGEAPEDCANCTGNEQEEDRNMDQVGELLNKIDDLAAEEDEPEEESDLVAFSAIQEKFKPSKKRPELVQIPVLGKDGNVGPCGSFHYNPDEPLGIDAFVHPITACVLTSVMQDWKKTVCPKGGGCTLQWGDAANGNSRRFPPHHSHSDGFCVDIRPMRKGGFDDSPLTYTAGGYDRATMKKLVEMFKAKGADTRQLFFNDTKLGSRKLRGHSNHIHVCFRPNKTTKEVCKGLKVDTSVCPELK
jgi:hypothetical protein